MADFQWRGRWNRWHIIQRIILYTKNQQRIG